MDRKDAIRIISSKVGVNRVQARQTLDLYFDLIKSEIRDNREFRVKGFGTFKPKKISRNFTIANSTNNLNKKVENKRGMGFVASDKCKNDIQP